MHCHACATPSLAFYNMSTLQHSFSAQHAARATYSCSVPLRLLAIANDWHLNGKQIELLFMVCIFVHFTEIGSFSGFFILLLHSKLTSNGVYSLMISHGLRKARM
eukprot:jgi/Ulvmu1/1780/UM118_0020.1